MVHAVNNLEPQQPTRQITLMPTTIVKPDGPPDWRDFRTLSADPTGQILYFIECYRQPAPDCQVLRFDRATQQLYTYQLPEGYVYLEAYVSPSGRKLAMVRIPNGTAFPETLEQRQIAIMNIDGSGFEVLPLAPGPKSRPTFNATDDRLAFWRAQVRMDRSAKTSASRYDVYEYSFDTRQEAQFAASYQFFQGGCLYYLSDQRQLLVHGDVPMRDEALFHLSTHEYKKRYPNHLFRLNRKQTTWTHPMYSREPFIYMMRVTANARGDIAFSAEAIQEGGSIFLDKQDGSFFRWSERLWPAFETNTLLYAALLDSELVGIYVKTTAISREHGKTRFLRLDMTSGEWRALPMPALSTAQSISVSLKPEQ